MAWSKRLDYPFTSGVLAVLNTVFAIALVMIGGWLAFIFVPLNVIAVAVTIHTAYLRGRIAAYKDIRDSGLAD